MRIQLLIGVLSASAHVAHAATTSGTSQPAWAALLPTVIPPEDDHWQCATETFSPYFQVPKPTADVLTAMQSYFSKLRSESCTLTGADELDCPYPDATRWCGITSTMATSVSAAYSAYGSSASSWWAAHSSRALELARDCPVGWYAEKEWSGQATWLNNTIIMAECYAAAHTAGASITKAPTATPRPGVTGTSTPAKTTSTSTSSSRGRGQAEAPGIWAIVGGGVAAVAAGARVH